MSMHYCYVPWNSMKTRSTKLSSPADSDVVGSRMILAYIPNRSLNWKNCEQFFLVCTEYS